MLKENLKREKSSFKSIFDKKKTKQRIQQIEDELEILEEPQKSLEELAKKDREIADLKTRLDLAGNARQEIDQRDEIIQKQNEVFSSFFILN